MSCRHLNHKPVALTGGGSAGHVSAHLALIPELKSRGLSILYLGCENIERQMMSTQDVSFISISAGKLRRSWSWKSIWRNLGSIFQTLYGTMMCMGIMLKHRPRCLVSRGGYVSFPPSLACWICRIPVIIIEADRTLGMSTKMSLFFAQKLLTAFPHTSSSSSILTIHTGLPINTHLFHGDRQKGLEICGFDPALAKRVLCVMGGSQGSAQIESLLARDLHLIIPHFYIIFLRGTATALSDDSAITCAIQSLTPQLARRIKIFGFLNDDLSHIYAASQLAVSRAGAHSIFELIGNHIPTLLVPLEHNSRGEQIENAEYLTQSQLALTARTHTLKEYGSLWTHLQTLDHQSSVIRSKQQQFTQAHPCPTTYVMSALEDYLS